MFENYTQTQLQKFRPGLGLSVTFPVFPMCFPNVHIVFLCGSRIILQIFSLHSETMMVSGTCLKATICKRDFI